MKVRLLNESIIKLQNKENVKILKDLIRPALGDLRKLNFSVKTLGNLSDGNPGIYFVFGKDSDFSKIICFNSGESIFVLGWTLGPAWKDVPKFICIALGVETNPKIARNLVVKMSKFDSVQAIAEFIKHKFYWQDFYKFLKMQQKAKNLPMDFDWR